MPENCLLCNCLNLWWKLSCQSENMQGSINFFKILLHVEDPSVEELRDCEALRGQKLVFPMVIGAYNMSDTHKKYRQKKNKKEIPGS